MSLLLFRLVLANYRAHPGFTHGTRSADRENGFKRLENSRFAAMSGGFFRARAGAGASKLWTTCA
jgi:hypothetical protein